MEFKAEYEELYKELIQLIGEKKAVKAVEDFKKVAYDNVIDHSPTAFTAAARLALLSANPCEDKFYAKN